jgi:hypothetical protein
MKVIEILSLNKRTRSKFCTPLPLLKTQKHQLKIWHAGYRSKSHFVKEQFDRIDNSPTTQCLAQLLVSLVQSSWR